MISDFWGVLGVLMHLAGVASAAYLLMLYLLRLDKKTGCVWLVEVHTADRARDRLYAMHMRRALLGESDRCTIVALDRGIAQADKKELQHFCASVPRMYCCKPEELSVFFRSETKDSQ